MYHFCVYICPINNDKHTIANVKLHNLNKFPLNKSYRYGELQELSELDQKAIQSEGIDEAWYWYAYGFYDGIGSILMRKGDGYACHNMSHCSCYGPINDLPTSFIPLNELRKQYEPNAELWSEVQELFYAAASGS